MLRTSSWDWTQTFAKGRTSPSRTIQSSQMLMELLLVLILQSLPKSSGTNAVIVPTRALPASNLTTVWTIMRVMHSWRLQHERVSPCRCQWPDRIPPTIPDVAYVVSLTGTDVTVLRLFAGLHPHVLMAWVKPIMHTAVV